MAYRTIGTLGGMIIPMVDDATVRPLAKLAAYPRLFISGIRMEPIEAVSEVDEPDMPPNIMLENMFTRPRPPRSLPTTAIARSTSRVVMPLEFMTCPMSMNNGSDISA